MEKQDQNNKISPSGDLEAELILTEDGSHSLFVSKIDESYHSTHGAVQESLHIFIEAGLKQCAKNEIVVLEIGFGTGLNALLTLIEAEKTHKKIHYISLEKYPVALDTALQLNYPSLIDETKSQIFAELHRSPWNQPVEITPFFTLEKIQTDFTVYQHQQKYDVVFFDAFSPEKQPEMWTEEQFRKIVVNCSPEAVITTYCAKGVVRRAMQTAGFVMERLPGPPGKREILRGRKK